MTKSPSLEHQTPEPSSYADPQRAGLTAADLFDGMTEHLFFTLGRRVQNASTHDLYLALSHAVRDRLMVRHLAYKDALREHRAKAVAYLSAEFLIGPQLGNNLLMLDIRAEAAEALHVIGTATLEEVLAVEEEPGLGNGGLGRLAACFLESLATLEIPATGYGLRYEFGIFDQMIRDGWQVEITDNWLKGGWPWELVQPDKSCCVGFGGCTRSATDENGHLHSQWIPETRVIGIPHDVPVLGYGVNTCGRLRLWRAAPCEAFDLGAFDRGDYFAAVESKVASETLSKVLYPNDGTNQGRRLRLRQQYFFVSCSLQDMLRSLHQREIPLEEFADHWAVQLNDTHPAIAVAELMRLLIDEHRLPWMRAWEITTRSLSYTNHTLLPEALECWDLNLFQSLLPRHLEIIYEINARFLQQVRLSTPGDVDLVRRMSIIDEEGGKAVRMAHLATVGSHRINGVAALHSDLIRTQLLADFARFWPERFTNVTNGVTPRRWLALANPPLAELLNETLGADWLTRPEALRELEDHAGDTGFLERWGACRLEGKRRLAGLIHERSSLLVDPTSLFDVQVKRIHEYKRQHLNALRLVIDYLRIKNGLVRDRAPRTVIFAGKAAPGYAMAKLIIRLIHGIADVVNADHDLQGLLKVVFLADYNVRLSEAIVPAADLSEQISTAGMEASGTGNMKFCLNGALTIGTLDGANVEILREVGAENFFLFGHNAKEIASLRSDGHRPWEVLDRLPELREAISLIGMGHFSDGDADLFQPLVRNLLEQDPFFVLADIDDYLRVQQEVDGSWHNRSEWQRRSLLNTARSGFFSSDRSIREYAEAIWQVKPLPLELACAVQPRQALAVSIN
ncbi:glycogen/starch/alpha-glucan phosphorylase [Synechococcus sp. CS-1328]|uniref:glycogen/starch/alpha-glucan phosphorylase n=1 Tax=Synechococcus sp. CS-1328 TaxID=2847976 RepID=UPI00223A6982|nr:glycogen/starch/alpha-glucan phosphorylase [Synechococcus sp. CS-1328]MCT0224823.1 glycogen/starch/alpha-glucan phosphorylase [Synechococcus sp. CS-1328]